MISGDNYLDRLRKFATNDCVLSLAGVAYNMLRLIGQLALLDNDAPVRHTAKRRRLRTVIGVDLCERQDRHACA